MQSTISASELLEPVDFRHTTFLLTLRSCISWTSRRGTNICSSERISLDQRFVARRTKVDFCESSATQGHMKKTS
jgi:hypothetical protein